MYLSRGTFSCGGWQSPVTKIVASFQSSSDIIFEFSLFPNHGVFLWTILRSGKADLIAEMDASEAFLAKRISLWPLRVLFTVAIAKLDIFESYLRGGLQNGDKTLVLAMYEAGRGR